jgi:NAD(P)-dependent dehydrogenase (short-subunit alcohol dehydrogenase family)
VKNNFPASSCFPTTRKSPSSLAARPPTPFTHTLLTTQSANGGIGFALAILLLEDPSNLVLLGSRSLSKGEAALQDLKKRDLPGTVELVQIDVDSEASVAAAAKDVEERFGRLDALVNNAAIAGEYTSNGTHEGNGLSTAKQLLVAFTTNTVGPAIVVEAFAPLLSKSITTARIINVTSGAGSISLRLNDTNPHQAMKVVPYRVSKAALHMITACQCYEYREKGWKIFNFCPGFTESNLGPHNTAGNGAKPTSEGARPMLAILAGERDAEHGGYLNGTEKKTWPW